QSALVGRPALSYPRRPLYIYPPSCQIVKVVKHSEQQQEQAQEYIHPYTAASIPSLPFSVRSIAIQKPSSMGRSAISQALPVHQEDEDLFETSSSFSCDSDDEAQFSDGEDQFVPASPPVRRLNSDSVYDLSSMKAELSVKKGGLSKYYDGKSQSFACMSEVRCLEDLPKKSPYKKIKSCRSNIDLDGNQKACPVPGSHNSKGMAKPSGSSCANLMARNNSANMLYRPPAIPVNKSACHQ
uniref:Uncharacterized protein n=2 Tax=Aegilops tauschii TaxID=37682 RepID=A0A453FFP1_AEGTS